MGINPPTIIPMNENLSGYPPYFNNVQNFSYIECIPLVMIVEMTSVLARHGQAIRGHIDKDSNFIRILNLLGKDN